MGLQAHNSSTGTELIGKSIQAVKAYGGNCLEAPVYWYRLEPEKDVYEMELVNESIETARAVVEDKEGNIWVGTNKGIRRLVYQGDKFQWKGDYEKNSGLEKTAVQTIYVNNSNQIYVSYLNMVVRIDGRDKEKLESVYTLDNGLTSGHIACMVDDQMGNTWAGNNVGIMTIRSGQEAFYNYLSTGNCCAVCRLQDGRLLWANSWGLFYFDPGMERKSVCQCISSYGGKYLEPAGQ